MTNKTVLITGASRGIGRAAAHCFAQAGYDLYLTCISSIDRLRELADSLSSRYNITCTAILADMGCYTDVERVFSQISDLDILVNNAGVSHVGLLSDMSPEEWHRVLGTNLDSCFYTSKLAIPLFLQKHSGKIINISSVWGNVGASMEVAYSASKGGINALTKALAKELAPSNIQVNAIAPGMIDTEMNHVLSKEDIASIIEEIPADRMGTPEEVALLVWQVAQAPSYMTGQIIALDGGWTC